MSVEIRSLQEVEVDAWIDHCMDVFKHDSPAYFRSHICDDERALEDLDNIVVAVEGATICATVRVVPRQQYFDGRVVSMGGIAEVSTKEAYRSKGLASKLLQAAIDGPLSRMELSCLHTNFDRLGGFYARHGWTSVEIRAVTVSITSLSDSLPPDVTIAPLDIHDKAETILQVYHRASSALNGPIVRSVSYITKWIAARHARYGIRSMGAFAPDGALLGYVFGMVNAKNAHNVHVDELIVPSTGNDKTAQILSEHLLASLVVELPLTAGLPEPLALGLHLPTTDEVYVDRGWMYRGGTDSVRFDELVYWITDAF
ncbi:hypothetical protein AeMF1_003070 [Aphanomyces euteiches]|nr:hypothetical protein AeMF1_003070 [Aphanomyces euteiches]KAH9191868.1 hypothetical protein AeNC1_006154 [Aphanomyces euteiches]